MRKYYCELNPIQKYKVNRWLKKHTAHYMAIKELHIVDVITLRDSTLLISFYDTPSTREKYIKVFEEHNEKYCNAYTNVIFIL